MPDNLTLNTDSPYGKNIIPIDGLLQSQNPVNLPTVPTNNPITINNVPPTTDTMPDYLKQYLNEPVPTNPLDTYNTLSTQYGVDEKQKKVNDLQAQLDAITAGQNVAELQLPKEGINQAGANARNITLERENAIRALPIQAQLLAAQGNLKAATDKLNTSFQIQNNYNDQLFKYKSDLRKSVYDYATEVQKQKLLAQQKADEKTQQDKKDLLNDAQSWASKASANGQMDLAAQFADPNITREKLQELAGKVAVTGTMRAVIDPSTGQITYYYVKPPAQGANGTNTNISTNGTNQTNVTKTNIPNFIKSATENYPGGNYIDMSKLSAQAQIVAAQNYSARTGTPLLSKEDANKVQEANASYQSASALIDKIRNLTKNVITAKNSVVDQTLQAANLKRIELAPYLSTNNDAKAFISARQSLLSLITRAAGEKGMLTNTDVQRIANALPSYGDNKDLAIQKATNLDTVIQSVFQGAVKAYIQNNGTGTSNSGSSGQTSSGLNYTIEP